VLARPSTVEDADSKPRHGALLHRRAEKTSSAITIE